MQFSSNDAALSTLFSWHHVGVSVGKQSQGGFEEMGTNVKVCMITSTLESWKRFGPSIPFINRGMQDYVAHTSVPFSKAEVISKNTKDCTVTSKGLQEEKNCPVPLSTQDQVYLIKWALFHKNITSFIFTQLPQNSTVLCTCIPKESCKENQNGTTNTKINVFRFQTSAEV